MRDINIHTLFAGVTVQDVDLEAWQRAWEAWLGRKRPNTRRAYVQAWDDLRQSVPQSPWQMTAADLEAWLINMRDRGLSTATIRLRLGAVSSFYGFVCQRFMVASPAGQSPLHHYNPVQAVELPALEKYTEAVYLSGEQVRALLRAIPRKHVYGLRNYALLLFYIASGRRSAEIRNLRWGDFKRDDPVRYRWSGKGRARWDECPAEVWAAIGDYLAAAGRLAQMAPDDYVFTALSDRAGRLPHVPEGYVFSEQPLSGTEVLRILRMYARLAGIQAAGLRVHSLRHTHAMLLRAVGFDSKAIQEQLGHADSKTTDRYLHTLAGGRLAGWARVRDYLALL